MGIANIEYHYSNKSKRYQINKINSVLKAYKLWVKQNIPAEVVITTDDDMKAIRKKRTVLNNEIKSIKDCYNAILGILMGDFLSQRKELEGFLQENVAKLTQAMNEYKKVKEEEEAKNNPVPEEVKEEVYEINFKTTDKAVYDKIMALIEELTKGGQE